MSLLELVAIILAGTVVTFGGGPSMVPILQAELVETRHVLTTDQLLYAFAVARATPGQANMYVTTVGYFLAGLPGAVLSTVALQAPGYVMLPLMGAYDRVRSNRTVGAFITGLTAASVGVIFSATVGMAQDALTEPISFVVFAVAIALLMFTKLPGIVTLVVAGAIGIGLRLAV